jgi:dihydrofolate reductase
MVVMKASVYIATSLDGFIARENGGIDWLESTQVASGNEDYGYKAFMESVDVLVMGRNTFELVLTFGEWPYGDKPVVVLSSRGVTIPDRLPKTVEGMTGTPLQVAQQLAARGWAHAYIDGGKTIQAFLNAGLIQEMIVTRIPILIGRGIPLFGPTTADVPLEHVETRSYPTGVVQSRYRVTPAPTAG